MVVIGVVIIVVGFGGGVFYLVFYCCSKPKQQSNRQGTDRQGTTKSWDGLSRYSWAPSLFLGNRIGQIAQDWTDWTVYSHTPVTSSTRGRRIFWAWRLDIVVVGLGCEG